MAKFLCGIMLTIFSLITNAQPTRNIYTSAVSRLEKMYNAGLYDSIYHSFSPAMQKALPLDKTRAFFSVIKSVSGKMLSADFEEFESGFASYKAIFERRKYSLNIVANDRNFIEGLLLKPYSPANLPKLTRNVSQMILPFNGPWTVFWGGDTKELNYHVEVPVQKGAFDFIVTDANGKAFKNEGKSNEDYYAFGKDLVAACDSRVIMVVDGIPDNVPGVMNPMFVTGNTVLLQTANNEFIIYAHFKKHSILVKEGQTVKKGEVLGLCGNSGNSNQPHLHFHIQNVADMNVATGAKVYFEKIRVNGVEKKENSPIKTEIIENIP